MAEEKEVYEGKVKKLTKDASQYIIDCPVVSEWYGVDARLEAKWAPEDLEIGDGVRFTVTETGQGAPIIDWVEKKKKKAKKKVAEEAEETTSPEEGAELYTGKVGNPTKDGLMYLVDCPVITKWYGVSARVSPDALFAAAAGTGDEILFSLSSDEKTPRVAWMDRADSAASKKRLAGEEPPPKKKPKQEEAKKDVSDELSALKDQLLATKMEAMEAKLEAERTKSAAAQAQLETIKNSASNGVAAALAAVTAASAGKKPADAEEESSEEEPIKPKVQRAIATVGGSIRFQNGDDALNALALFGMELNGVAVSPELDSANLSIVRCKDLHADTTPEQLKEFFKEAGTIVGCSVAGKEIGEPSPNGLRSENGKGKGKKGKGDGKGDGKGAGKGKAAVKGSTKGATKGATKGTAAAGVKGSTKGKTKKKV